MAGLAFAIRIHFLQLESAFYNRLYASVGDAVVDKQPELEQVEDAKLESGSMQPSETRQVLTYISLMIYHD